MGDSLLKKIDEGLASCDFGVVILSKAFFAVGKKWTRAELDGLFGRETPAKKIILPIWKDISHEAVAKFSPILAGKVAAQSSAGVEKVVESIRIAIDASVRTARQLTGLEEAMNGLMMLDRTIHEQQEAGKLLDSKKGADLVLGAFDALFQTFERESSRLNQTSNVIKFKVTKSPLTQSPEFYVNTVLGLSLGVQLRCLHSNSAQAAILQPTLFQQQSRIIDGRRPQPEEIFDMELKPSISIDGQVAWIDQKGRRFGTNEELVAHLVARLTIEVGRHVNRQPQSDF